MFPNACVEEVLISEARQRAAGVAVFCAALGVIFGVPALGQVRAAGVGADDAGRPVTVQVRQGAVRGVEQDGTVRFLGIPYAAPPVGAARWLPPTPAPAHGGTLEATDYGPVCPQPRSENADEGCLTINVWTPAADDAARPVMVWLHGGGFRAGSGAIPGELFAQEGIVIASLNYRLGPLGFLSPSGARPPRSQLRPHGHGAGADLGARQHRRLRRQPRSGDHLRHLCRRHGREPASRERSGRRPLPRRHLAKRLRRVGVAEDIERSHASAVRDGTRCRTQRGRRWAKS